MAVFSVAAASASSQQAGYEAANAFNGTASLNAGMRWGAFTAAAWLQADLGSAKTATYYAFAKGFYSDNQNPRDWTFEGSNDAASWTVLDTQANVSFTAIPALAFPFTNAVAYRYYRINITATAGNDIASISELVVGNPPASPTSIIESTTTNIDAAISATVSITNTPVTDDVVLVSIASDRTDVTVAGLGATWTEIRDGAVNTWSSFSHSVWKGVGAATSGNITISAGAAVTAQVAATLVRGNDGTLMQPFGNSASFMTGPAGQVAFSTVYETGAGTPTLNTSTTVPTWTTWTLVPLFTSSAGVKIRQAYRLADSSSAYTAQWTNLGAAGVDQTIVGLPIPTVSVAQTEGVYLEALAAGVPNVQTEGVYIEALAAGAPNVLVGGTFLEVLTYVQPAPQFTGWGLPL